MASPTKVVLLACGSFNPITNMHLRMFELARDALNKSGRYVVIGGIISPVHDKYQKEDLMSSKHRCSMIKLSLNTSDWIRCDEWECKQKQWLPTLEVLKHFQCQTESDWISSPTPGPSKRRKIKDKKNEDTLENTHPRINVNESNAVQLKLLCGADLLESFAKPGLWKEEDMQDIVEKYGLVCITRAGSDARKFIYESDLLFRHQENIQIVTEWIYNDLSATKIRRSLRRGESVKYLLQDAVVNYIKEHQLYHNNETLDNKYLNHITPSPNAECRPDINHDTIAVADVTTHKVLSNPHMPVDNSPSCAVYHQLPLSGGQNCIPAGVRQSPVDANYNVSQKFTSTTKERQSLRGSAFEPPVQSGRSLSQRPGYFKAIEARRSSPSPQRGSPRPSPQDLHPRRSPCTSPLGALMKQVKNVHITVGPETCV